MTEDERSCVAHLVQGYSETKRKIALHRECLRASGKHLRDLGDQLERNPLGIVSGGGAEENFVIKPYGAASPEEIPFVNLGSLAESVHDLRVLIAEKADLEVRLQQLGLGTLTGD